MITFRSSGVFVGLMVAIVCAPSSGLAVTCNPPTTHLTIQRAVNDPDCDLILLDATTYFENVFIDRTVTIEGLGAQVSRIDGGGWRRTVTIDSLTNDVILRHLTIQNGFAPSGLESEGGGVFVGHASELDLESCWILDNEAFDEGGGVYYGPFAGGRISDTLVAGNVAGGAGGGLTTERGPVMLAQSAIVGNQSGTDGGGVALWGAAILEAVNVTVSGNSADGSGGGIGSVGNNYLTLNNTTITDNQADADGDGSGDGGGLGVAVGFPTLTVSNTVVSGNSVFGDPSSAARDCSGTFVSAGHNLIGVACGGFINGVNDDQVGTAQNPADALLLPLSPLFGSTTPVHIPQPGSSVLDAGAPPSPPGGLVLCEEIDQRRVPRPQDGNGDGDARCDIGSVEVHQIFSDGFESGDTSAWSSVVEMAP